MPIRWENTRINIIIVYEDGSKDSTSMASGDPAHPDFNPTCLASLERCGFNDVKSYANRQREWHRRCKNGMAKK